MKIRILNGKKGITITRALIVCVCHHILNMRNALHFDIFTFKNGSVRDWGLEVHDVMMSFLC